MHRNVIASLIFIGLLLIGGMAVLAAEDVSFEIYFLSIVIYPEPPTATPQPTDIPPPQPTPTNSGVPSFCSCTGPDLDCGDFSTHN